MPSIVDWLIDPDQYDHNRGQEDGAAAAADGGPSIVDQVYNDFQSESYKQGFENGVNDPPSSNDD